MIPFTTQDAELCRTAAQAEHEQEQYLLLTGELSSPTSNPSPITTENEFSQLADEAIHLFNRLSQGFETSSQKCLDPTERMRIGMMYALYNEIYSALTKKRFDLERAHLGTYQPGSNGG